MKIGETIRTYRKAKHLTQEEMANQLGVTAPAVNKWENGNSLPDIALLSPICRLLGITPDVLLSFEEALTPEEIARFIGELNERLKAEPFAAVFPWAKQKISQYPNCEQLLWQTALVLDAWRKTHPLPDAESYDAPICGWYIRALESEDETIRTHAADSLFHFYTAQENYGEAEKYLSYFSLQNPERKRKQAFLCSKTGRTEEAWKAYEELLFSGYQMASLLFYSMHQLAAQEKDLQKAKLLVEKQLHLVEAFDMGQYQTLACRLEQAILEQDAPAVCTLVKGLLEDVSSVSHFRQSPLYAHLDFTEPDSISRKDLQKAILESCRSDPRLAFLQNDARWQALIK